jgi:RNA polymerase sigma-70 factor (ECF subfamily)
VDRSLGEQRDEDLLGLFLKGNEGAFAELMRRHEDRIFGLACRIVGDRADALDATQETFVSAFRQASSFRGQAAFSTWLYRIGINACRDLLRKKKRLPEPQEEILLPQTGVSSDADTVSLRVDLARALASLPEDYREAVLLHDVGGVPYEEIALLTSVAIGTVKSRISRGRRKLASLLEQPSTSQASKEE